MRIGSKAIAESIKNQITMSDILSLYGFSADSAGFIHCPFHSGDNSPSLKIYKGKNGWHCFGCHKGGSVIDFVLLIEDCDFSKACEKIDTAFNLGLKNKYSSSFGRAKSAVRANLFAKKREELERKAVDAEIDYLKLIKKLTDARNYINWHHPRSADDLTEELAKAYKDEVTLDYLTDIAGIEMTEAFNAIRE